MEQLNKQTGVGTKAAFLALDEIEQNKNYYITDLASYAISNADMQSALTSESALYNYNDLYICKDDGDYKRGHIYLYTLDGWEDITPEGTVDYNELQNTPIINVTSPTLSELPSGVYNINVGYNGFPKAVSTASDAANPAESTLPDVSTIGNAIAIVSNPFIPPTNANISIVTIIEQATINRYRLTYATQTHEEIPINDGIPTVTIVED